MALLTDRVGRIQPSATLAMTAKAAELKRKNLPVFNMSVGEPDLPTPKHIQDAGIFAIQNGHTRYTPGGGTHNLKVAIQKKLTRDNNLNYNLNELVVSSGAKHSLYNACQVLFQKQDEVIIFSPYWVSFPDFVSVTGAKPIFVNTNKKAQFEPDFDDLEKKINKNTKGIIINSPSNPTGGVWSDEAIERILDMLKKRKDIWIFSDECYEQLTYDYPFKSIASFDRSNKNILTFQSCSKTYAMTGWRIGYIAGDSKVVSAVTKLQGQSTSCPNSIAQYAATAALIGDQKCVTDMKNIFLRRRDLILLHINDLEHLECAIPQGAFYVFPDFSKYIRSYDEKERIIKTSSDLSLYLLNDTGVVTVAGDSFGAPNYIRLSYATSDEIINEALQLIKSSLAKLTF